MHLNLRPCFWRKTGLFRARRGFVTTETGLANGFAKVLGAAVFRCRCIQNLRGYQSTVEKVLPGKSP